MKKLIRQILKEEKNILPPNVKDLVRSLPIELKELLFKQWHATQNEKWHPEGNTLKHIIIVLKRAYHHYPNDPNMIIASLFHDLGKMDTHKINPKTGKPTAYGHEKEAVIYVEKFKDWIESFEGTDVEEIKYIVKNHMKVKPTTWEVMKDSKKEPIKTHKSFEKLMGFTNKLDGGGINITETIKKILKEDRRQMYLDTIVDIMKNDYPLFNNMKLYGFYDQLSKDELNYVLSGVFGRNVEIVPSYYTQIVDEFGNLLYLEVEDGCLEGTFVNYLEDIDNIDSTEDMYDCVWNEASDIMDYIGGFFDTEFEPFSLDEFLHEYWDILNKTMKNDIMFLLSEL